MAGKLIKTVWKRAEINKNRIVWMEYVEPSGIPDRQVMTLAMFGSDTNMLRKIINFNNSVRSIKFWLRITVHTLPQRIIMPVSQC